MRKPTRVFDFVYDQLERFPLDAMLASKENETWKTHSTSEVISKVNELSVALQRLGLSAKNHQPEQQDKIAVISKNRPEWLMLDLATQQIGVLLCPIYPTTHPDEIKFILNDAEVKYVFVSGQDIADKVIGIEAQIPSLKGIFGFDVLEGTTDWNSLFSEPSSSVEKEALEKTKSEILPEHCVTIIYTSGTTGTPKGVMLSHANLVSNVINSTQTFPFPEMPGARALSFLPLNHIFERMASFIYISTGIGIYYAESLETIGENLKEVKPVLFTTVPRLLEKMYEKIIQKGSTLTGVKKALFNLSISVAEQFGTPDSEKWNYSFKKTLADKLVFSKWRAALGGNIQYIITGGAAASERLLRIFSAAGIQIYEGYGPTENSPVISVNCQKPEGKKFGTVGLVIEGQKVKLEEDGEICVKGPSVMMGYYKRPDLTDEVIIDGWLHTGDIGTWIDGKYLKITDRKKEMFKTSGGKYVAPQPIENKLKESPFIEQVMIVGADRKFVAALLVPGFHQLEQWMTENQISFNTREEALKHPLVIRQYEEIIEHYNKMFNHVEQVRKFVLLHQEWSVDNGEMTPKLSMRRKIIFSKNIDLIEELYNVK
jgi:long-chain acyl-CoA synthetase